MNTEKEQPNETPEESGKKKTPKTTVPRKKKVAKKKAAKKKTKPTTPKKKAAKKKAKGGKTKQELPHLDVKALTEKTSAVLDHFIHEVKSFSKKSLDNELKSDEIDLTSVFAK